MAGVPRYSDEDVNLKVVWSRFWELVDSDSVRPFVWLYYLPLLAFAIYSTIWAQPIGIVESVMGHTFYQFWVWIQIPATLSALIGLVLRHGGTSVSEITKPLLRRDWLGLWMQFGGHACMCLALLAFETSAIKGAYWGEAVFSVFAISSYVVGTFLLSLQCLRKLWRGEQLEHR